MSTNNACRSTVIEGLLFSCRSEAESGRTNDAVIKADAKLPTPQQLSKE